jgi:hypothetical protein
MTFFRVENATASVHVFSAILQTLVSNGTDTRCVDDACSENLFPWSAVLVFLLPLCCVSAVIYTGCRPTATMLNLEDVLNNDEYRSLLNRYPGDVEMLRTSALR